MRSWFLGLWYLGFGLFVESYNVTLYWLKESILKNWLLGFLPHEGFLGSYYMQLLMNVKEDNCNF
jgi:hypothetical protein